MKIEFKTLPSWQDLDELAQLKIDTLVKEHLESSNYRIFGYWDEKDEFYEEIIFVSPITAELVSSSLGTSLVEDRLERWIQIKALLKAAPADSEQKLIDRVDKLIGELTLIFDSKLNFVDENWLIDIESPFVVAKREKDFE